MKTELVVRGEKREVMTTIAEFLDERKDLYGDVRGPSRWTDDSVVEATVSARHARFVVARGCLAMIAGLVALDTMETIGPDPRIKVSAKAVSDGLRLKIATQDSVKPEAVEPLLAWLRDELDAEPS